MSSVTLHGSSAVFGVKLKMSEHCAVAVWKVNKYVGGKGTYVLIHGSSAMFGVNTSHENSMHFFF